MPIIVSYHLIYYFHEDYLIHKDARYFSATHGDKRLIVYESSTGLRWKRISIDCYIDIQKKLQDMYNTDIRVFEASASTVLQRHL